MIKSEHRQVEEWLTLLKANYFHVVGAMLYVDYFIYFLQHF